MVKPANIKGLVITIGLILFMAGSANAQGGQQMGTPEERADRQIAQLVTLNLSAEQKAKLKEVFIWSAKRTDSISTTLTDGGDFLALRTKMAPLQAETSTKINALLNDEQKKAYEAILEDRRARMRNN
jgi:periplasmic protein CpxP/Spy